MAAVYNHIRKDNGQIFWVGICKQSRIDTRPSATRGKNAVWKRIVKETDYEVVIKHSGISMKSAKRIEIKDIKKHGKILYGTGILANVMDGGDHEYNWRVVNEIKELYDKLGYTRKKKKNKEYPNSVWLPDPYLVHGVKCVRFGYKWKEYKDWKPRTVRKKKLLKKEMLKKNPPLRRNLDKIRAEEFRLMVRNYHDNKPPQF